MFKSHLTTANLIIALAVWTAISTTLVFIFVMRGGTPAERAVICMGAGLVLLWIVLAGSLMRIYRDRIKAVALAVPLGWKAKFILFATLLALIEEVITTTMTNMAPIFGVPVGAAYITASANYFDVVLGHSVIVFVPMFVAWAWLLSRWNFHPNAVFLLFGLTGTLAEAGTFGARNLAQVGFWTFVYGLMVYLPAYTLPQRSEIKTPKASHYLLAVFLPFLFAAPVAGVVGYLHPVKIHFPPLNSHTASVSVQAWGKNACCPLVCACNPRCLLVGATHASPFASILNSYVRSVIIHKRVE
jgi:hypothetical protein